MRGMKLLFLIAVLLGLITSIVVFRQLDTRTISKEPEQQMGIVVVTTKDIPRGGIIKPDMVKLSEIPLDYVHPSSFDTITSTVGAVTSTKLVAGEQILSHHLLNQSGLSGLTATLPPGMRALTIGVNEVVGVGGFVKPGDTVDILGTFEDRSGNEAYTKTVLQDVEVLAIEQDMEVKDDTTAKVATNVTLSLSLQDAERLTLAEETGRLRLALRPMLDSTKDVKGVSLSQLVPGVVSKPQASTIQQSTPDTPGVTVTRVEPSRQTATSDTTTYTGNSKEVYETEVLEVSHTSNEEQSADDKQQKQVVEVIRGTDKDYVVLRNGGR
jgi:pilus assembly protein CpaB